MCFFNRQKKEKHFYWPTAVCVRNSEWKWSQCTSDSCGQVMRNPALASAEVLLCKAQIHLEWSRISSGSTILWLSKCSGVWDIWGTDLNISHLHCKWIGSPGPRGCQQLTLYESFIHQLIFPCEQRLLWEEAGGGEKCSRTSLFLKLHCFVAAEPGEILYQHNSKDFGVLSFFWNE